MVTVISSKEKSTTPVSNGVTGGSSCDNERPFQFIKDYQEVDFHRTPSCKPLPNDLFDVIDGQISKSSIQGMFFLQIDRLEPSSNNQNQQTPLVLTLTDGICTVKAMTIEPIANLTFNTKIGSKLLLTDTIAIQNGLLQLTHDNTRFQSGSKTYPRPRTGYRGNRTNRSSNDGRRNNRYDNDGNETNFSKRPPPKTTLMDFLPLNKILSDEVEIDKSKDHRSEISHKRQSNGNNSTTHSADNEQDIIEQDGFDEPSDYEDDPTHGNHRERRNPLPPRLQRAQEERSRRNTNRLYDESISLGNPTSLNNHPLSSTLPTHLQHVDQGIYNTYSSSFNGPTGPHFNYYSTNTVPFIYNLTSISTPTYPNHQPLLAPSYLNESIDYCCNPSYGNYLSNNGNGEEKIHSNNDTVLGSNDDANDSGMKSESSSNEPKSTPPPPIVSSSNDNQTNFSGGKRRDSNTNRPRWKIGDTCFARWSEDGEFYYASIIDIRPPFCTVLFNEYNTYDQVHFSHLKIIPRDQQYYSFVPPSSDLHMFPPNVFYTPRSSYYTPAIDGCIIMPEVPPFPFNSSGTLYMCPGPSFLPMMQSNGGDSGGNGGGGGDGGDGATGGDDLTMNSSLSPSKDSNDTSAIDSTNTSTDDNQQQQQQKQEQISYLQPCSIADAPLTLVTSDDLVQLDIHRININEEQPLTKEVEEEEDEKKIRE